MNFNFYLKLHSNETISNDTLQGFFNDKVIKEAIFLASPNLFFEIEKWINGQLSSKKEAKIRFALLKYLIRMSTRCTPFGLFAGCGIGSLSDNTDIVNFSPYKNRRHTRLDMNYLVALSQDLAKNTKIREQLLYFPNTSIYNVGNKLRYIEYNYIESRRHHQIVEIENSIYLDAILKFAKRGAYLKDIVHLLMTENIDADTARRFVQELLANQVLTSELEPSVSGPGSLNQILDILRKIEGVDKEISFLKKISGEIQELDLIIGNDIDKYLNISNKIKETSTKFQLKYLFQTDLELCPKKNHLSKSIADSVLKGILYLNFKQVDERF